MKKKIFQAVFLLLVIALLHGCALVDKHLFNPAASHARIDPLFRTDDCKNYVAPDGKHWLTTLLEGSTRNMSSFIFKDVCEYQSRSINDGRTIKEASLQDGTKATVISNGDRIYFDLCESTSASTNLSACLSYLISKSDEICNIHKSHVYGDRTAMNTVLGALALGAGVAGTMTGTTVTQYLAGSAGFVTGSQALINNEIYRNFVTNAILKEIDHNREEFLKTLATMRSGASIDLGQVRLAALQYHNKCSFYDGLASLLNKAGDKTDITSNPAIKELASRKEQLDLKISELKQAITAATDQKEKERLTKVLNVQERLLAMTVEVLANTVAASVPTASTASPATTTSLSTVSTTSVSDQ